MFELTTAESQPDRFTRHQLLSDGAPVTFDWTIDAWKSNESFREFFSQSLTDSPFDAFRWETPPLTRETATRPFEFVLVNTPSFCQRSTDSNSFRKKFEDGRGKDVVTFSNLGGDATMIVPTSQDDTDIEHFGHLASFIRNASAAQVHSLWKTVGDAVHESISEAPIWLSTAGGGVAWLHVRIDSSPKYYSYSPYRKLP